MADPAPRGRQSGPRTSAASRRSASGAYRGASGHSVFLCRFDPAAIASRAGRRVRMASADARLMPLVQHDTMIASDLDRTLIYSASALQLPTVDEESPNLISV